MCKLSLCLLVALLGCLVAQGWAGAVPSNDIHRDIIVVKNVREFAALHPGLKMQRLTKQPSARSSPESVRYTIGARLSGDRLVAQGADVYHYQARKDVSVQLTYPESGTGAIITFVELVCTQDNKEGNAYIVAGGIGQRFISILLEANETESFAYQAQYYGSG